MSGAQALAGAAGIGLIAANEWASGDRGVFGGVIWNPGTDPATAHAAVRRLGAELLFVVVAVLLAGLGGSWETMVLAALAAVWVLFLINRYGKK